MSIGESAGAWSVGYHLFYRQSWPYFRNAILESGGPTYQGFFAKSAKMIIII